MYLLPMSTEHLQPFHAAPLQHGFISYGRCSHAMMQEVQWLLITVMTVMYALQTSGVGATIRSYFGKRLRSFSGGTATHGPPLLAPEKTSSESGQKTWSHNVEDAFSKLSEGSAETLKLLQSLASKRPHLDLIAGLKTMADLAKVQMDDIWGKLENANFMTAQQRMSRSPPLPSLARR